MNKQIRFAYDGKDYILEFTRDTVRQMERGGFSMNALTDKPMTCIPDLFAGAFLKNHSSIRRSKVDTIYESLKDRNRLIRALIDMYNESVESLMDDDAEGNAEWTPNWEIED